MNVSSQDIWYGWIPSNSGEIKLYFVTRDNVKKITNLDRINFKKKDTYIEINNIPLDIFSDTNPFVKLLRRLIFGDIEYVPMLNILRIQESTKENFDGHVKITYKDNAYAADFVIFKNGKSKFKFTNIEEKSSQGPIEDIKQIIYLTIKYILHGDNHHHQKIDTVLKIKRFFVPEDIMIEMLSHIKKIDHELKRLEERINLLDHKIKAKEAEGYLSYMASFLILFSNSQNIDKLKYYYSLGENIIKSINANIIKKSTLSDYKKALIVRVLAIVGMVVSISILFSRFMATPKDKLDIICFIGIIIFIALLAFWIDVIPIIKKIIFYKHYKIFVFFLHIKKILYRYIKLFFVSISVLYVVLYIVYYNEINFIIHEGFVKFMSLQCIIKQ